MKQTVTKTQFTDIMTNHGFSYDGANALFEWLEEYEESTGEQLELDPIALRCEFAEYATLKELRTDYDVQKLKEYRVLITHDSGYIVHTFA